MSNHFSVKFNWTMFSPDGARWSRLLVSQLLLALAYLLLGRLALLLAIPPGYAMAIYPPAGIALGMILVGGYRLLPGVAVGSFLLNTWISWETQNGLSPIALGLAATIAAGAVLQAAFGVLLVKRLLGYPLALDSNRDILRFMLLAGPFACLINASVGVTALWSVGIMPVSAIWNNWATWWMGDTLGVIVFSPACLILFGKPTALWRSRRYSVMLPQLLSFVMVAGSFVLVRNWEQAQLANEFRSRAQAIASTFQSRLDSHVESQKTISGLFSNFGIITSEQMQNFAQGIMRQHPELMAIQWAALVPDELRVSYETAMTTALKKEFKIRELVDGQLRDAGRRVEYVPITYVAPLLGNEFILGFDTLSIANRRLAIQEARTTGLTVSTEPLTLVEDKSGELSSVLVTPAYDDLGLLWQPGRLGKFKGVVLTILRPAEVLASVNVGSYRQDMLLKLVDRQFNGKAYLDQVTKDIHPYQSDINLTFAGRTLLLTAQPTAIFLSNHIPWVAWISLGGGMLFCGVIGMYLLMMSGRSFGIESLVQKRTLELQESKWSLQSILENAADGILTVNADGQIALANRAAEHLLHEKAGQLEGKYVDRLFIDANNKTFAIQEIQITAFDEVLVAKEMRHVFTDGSEISLELAISKVQRDAQPFYILILHDLTERKRADKIKGEFVSAVSHELRTPLTSIRGTLGLVVAGALGEVPEKAMKMLKLANNNAERLHTLVNDLLDFEKLEFGGMLFKLTPCRLNDLLRKSVEYNLAYAEKFSVQLCLQVPDDLQETRVNVDESRLIQVLSNLISNAIKFSPANDTASSQVIIRLELRDTHARVSVEDKGIGISDEFRERIFSKFSQADGSGTRNYAGTGLGLSLAKAMVEKMQGSIGFDSVFGEGSSFYVEFAVCDS